ncbi:CBO0543 family protein [Peribacillus sp. SCS-155]|uniref:CBO0543 family protein n=1 Tax=Peribacillus sedimenti TaxID=3115297 RepID=UPI003906BD39
MIEPNWTILISLFALCGLGCIFVARKNFKRYGLVFSISLVISAALCLFFYLLGFYQFALPLSYVIPAAAVSFSFLVLFTIRFTPIRQAFSFYFMIVIFIFSLEVLIIKLSELIRYRSGWDFWDSYTFYWAYTLGLGYIGGLFIPAKYRNPVDSDSKVYKLSYYLSLFFAILLFIYIYSDYKGYI